MIRNNTAAPIPIAVLTEPVGANVAVGAEVAPGVVVVPTAPWTIIVC